jgi:hypothetical protein
VHALRAVTSRRVASSCVSPFFDARIFAGQFGTQEARDHLLEGLTKAGFH